MEIQQQINSLYELARDRENARLQFKEFDPTIDSRSFLEINDSSTFDSMEAAYAEFNRLDNEVKKQSAALFTNLSKGMQYGMTVHEKPLLVGELDGDWLVLKVKSTHTAFDSEDTASPTYRCDVERIKPQA
jgi:arginine utilization protein RocB